MTAKHTESENTPSIIPNGIKINLSPKVILCIALLVGGGAGGATIGKLFGVDTEIIAGNTKEQFEKNNKDREEDLFRINTTLDKHTEKSRKWIHRSRRSSPHNTVISLAVKLAG